MGFWQTQWLRGLAAFRMPPPSHQERDMTLTMFQRVQEVNRVLLTALDDTQSILDTKMVLIRELRAEKKKLTTLNDCRAVSNGFLQEENRKFREGRAQAYVLNGKLQKENEELQSTLDDVQVVAIDPLMAEMNRLRQEIDGFKAYKVGVQSGYGWLHEEITKLREEKERLLEKNGDFQRGTDKLWEKNEQMRQELADVNETLQLHQTSDGYEAGQHYAEKALGADIRRLRELSRLFQEALRNRQELIGLLNDQNNEKNEEIKKLELKTLSRDMAIEKLQQLVRDREADCPTYYMAVQQEETEILLLLTDIKYILERDFFPDAVAEQIVRKINHVIEKKIT